MKKNDKLFILGITAWKCFYMMIHENLEVCQNLFAIDDLRVNYCDLLYVISKNLVETNNGDSVKLEYIQEVEENMTKKYGHKFDINEIINNNYLANGMNNNIALPSVSKDNMLEQPVTIPQKISNLNIPVTNQAKDSNLSIGNNTSME